VVTTTDAGGPLEFVSDGETGLVAPPDAEGLGEALDRIATLGEARLRDMGEEGRRRVAHIGWDRVLDRLTGSLA
jgi:glycosyltransferase involved in cell wall biosynthesis